eukprot:g2831.t1
MRYASGWMKHRLIIPLVVDSCLPGHDASCGCRKDVGPAIAVRVDKVERIENPRVWETYAASLAQMKQLSGAAPKRSKKKEQTQSKDGHLNCNQPLEADNKTFTEYKIRELDEGRVLANLDEDVNEVYLWHGTPKESAEHIVEEGFDPSKSRDGLYGPGVYFAENFCKSCQYIKHGRDHEYPGAGEQFTVLLCRVALGQVHKCTYIAESKRKREGCTCHSLECVPADQVHREFKIMGDNSYPEYLVTFHFEPQPQYWSAVDPFVKAETHLVPSGWAKRKGIIPLIQGTVMKSDGHDHAFGCGHGDNEEDGMCAKIKIDRVERVQNPKLWSKYNAKLSAVEGVDSGDLIDAATMDLQNLPAPDPRFLADLVRSKNEMYLWHGTDADAVASIVKEGFKLPKVSEKQTYGPGVYFAENICKANQYCTSMDQGKSYVLILARVCMGKAAVANSPGPPASTVQSLVVKKTVDKFEQDPTGQVHREFVVFEEARAYPEYVIHFHYQEEQQVWADFSSPTWPCTVVNSLAEVPTDEIKRKLLVQKQKLKYRRCHLVYFFGENTFQYVPHSKVELFSPSVEDLKLRLTKIKDELKKEKAMISPFISALEAACEQGGLPKDEYLQLLDLIKPQKKKKRERSSQSVQASKATFVDNNEANRVLGDLETILNNSITEKQLWKPSSDASTILHITGYEGAL